MSFLAELLLLVFAILLVAVFLGLDSEKLRSFERLTTQIEQAPNIDALMLLFEPYIKSPLTLIAGLSFLGIFVPVIEELAKSIGVWLVYDRLESTAQGFALGFLSGAGFALVESISVSLTPDETWALTFVTRSISGIMHMIASGIVGWGIAYARLEKRYLRTLAAILFAMLLHGLWNAGVVLAVYGGARLALSMPDLDVFGMTSMLGGVSLVFMLIPAMIIGLIALKLRLQSSNRINITEGLR
jgi:RsiW-degrading membrane proteinase PrsW (M82 family)